MSDLEIVMDAGERVMAGSMCDRCYNPGVCCHDFPLGGGVEFYGKTKRAARKRLRAIDGNPKGQKMPFVPFRLDKEADVWRWTCPKLGENGRCMIYEDRPDTCREFEPASTDLCVHFKGAEAGACG